MSRDVVPTVETLERTREEMGLNQPFLVQYVRWVSGLPRGDLGESYHFRKPVGSVLLNRMPNTFTLALASLGLIVATSLPLGMIAAVKRNRLIDYLIRIITFFSLSIPGFWLGLMLMYIVAVRFGLVPIMQGSGAIDLLLPTITLSVPLIGRYVRIVRTVILEELSMDYAISARARGISEICILIFHVLPNALPGLLTLIGMTIASLLGGTIVVEHLFMRPGLGSMVLQAISYRDYPLLQGFVLLMVLTYVSISFLVDILTKLLDPRILLIDRKEEIS